jgi:hypothetical protein
VDTWYAHKPGDTDELTAQKAADNYKNPTHDQSIGHHNTYDGLTGMSHVGQSPDPVARRRLAVTNDIPTSGLTLTISYNDQTGTGGEYT